MPPLLPDIQALFGQVCLAGGVSFLILVGVLALTRRLFGLVENDEDWNG